MLLLRRAFSLLSLLVIGSDARPPMDNSCHHTAPSLQRLRSSRHHAQLAPSLQCLRGGSSAGTRIGSNSAPIDIEEVWSDTITVVKRCFSVAAIACNPVAWCTQWVSRFVGSRWYAIWFVRNHVSWQQPGHLVKISRFRYRTPECPSVVSVRPSFGCVHLEVWNAWADLVIVPGVIDRIFLRSELGRRENTDEKEPKTNLPKEARFCGTAMATIFWWAHRVATHQNRVVPVLSLFGSSGIERIAGRVARDRTVRRMDSGEFDIAADAQSLCGLAVRGALAWWMDRKHAVALGSLALASWLLGGSVALKRSGREWLPWYAILLASWRLGLGTV